MVYYFIIGADGNRYGPADIDTLVQWTQEGRIVGSTALIERGTERQITADSLTAVAAELSKHQASTGPAVTIERDPSPRPDAPTLPHPGRRATAGFEQHKAGPPAPPAMPGFGVRGRSMPLSPKSRLVAGLLGIFLGSLGVHRFYLGYIGIGILQLVLTFLTCGVTGIWGFVEGIICLTGGMRDSDGLELRD